MLRKKLTNDNLLELVKETSDYLGRGHAVIFPTDTFYALGVDALNESAIQRFFALKRRPANKPVPVFVRDIKMAHELAFIDKRQEDILSKLWPGSFTIVLHKRDKVSVRLSAQSDKIGLRVPDNKFCQTLLNIFGKPITSSSANISGMEAEQDLDKVFKQFKEKSILPEFVVDASGIVESFDSIGAHTPKASTVIDITSAQPKILRINQTTLPKLQSIFDKLNF